MFNKSLVNQQWFARQVASRFFASNSTSLNR
jgi:hypothetical protein